MPLLIPTRHLRQPQGPVEIDWSHPLTRGLVFFAIGNAPGAPDLVGGGRSLPLGSSGVAAGRGGIGFNSSTSGNSGTTGWHVPYDQQKLRSIGTDFTVATEVNIVAAADSSRLVSIPWDQAGFISAPWFNIDLTQGGTGNLMLRFTTDGATSIDAGSDVTTVQPGWSTLIATRSGAAAGFTRNGEPRQVSWNNFTAAPVQWGTSTSVAILNGHPSSPSYAVNGTAYWAALWNRALSLSEQRDIYLSPYQILKPARRFIVSAEASVPPTRFYLPSTGTVPISPAFDATWDDTSSVVRRPANTVKGTSSFVEVSDTEASATNTWDVALGQFISESMTAQTISGTVKGYIRAREEAAGVNARSQIVVRVVSGDGSVVRGTLLGQDNSTTAPTAGPTQPIEWVVATPANSAAQSRNASFPATTAGRTLTSVTVQDGDRLVIEVGARCVNTATTATFAVAMRFGENAADLAENETGVTEGAPWVEFSDEIQFSIGATPHAASGGMVSAKPQISGDLTQTFPARSVSGALASPKPSVSGTLTQSFPARSVSGGLVSAKPLISGALTQTIPASSVSGTLLSPKPSASGALTQTFPARSISGGLVSPKPGISGTLTQTFPARSISGAVVSAKPRVSGTLTQTFPASAFSGELISPKPAASGILTQSFPARSISGGLVSKKPIASGTLTQSAISPHAISGGMVSAKPIVSGVLTQSDIASHSVSGGMVSKKPIAVGVLAQSGISPHALFGGAVSPRPFVGGTLTQTFPARSFSGGLLSKKPIISGVLTQSAIAPHSIFGEMVSKKPQISGGLSQGDISSHALLGSLVSPKPIVGGNLTQTLGAFTHEFTDEFDKTPISSYRSFFGALVSAKPRISGDMVQAFPAGSISGLLASPKPTMAGQLFQGALFGYEFSGGLISAKPRIAGSLTQTLFPSNITGSLVSTKPRIVGTLTQTPLPNSFGGALVSPKPNIVGLIAQGQIGSSSFSAILVSPKSRIAGALTQSAIAAQTFSGSLVSSKPRISGTLIQQALGGFELSGGLVSPKPRVLGTLTQTFPARFISGGMVSKKPAVTAILTQTRLPHAIGGGMVLPRPRLFGSFVQNLLAPHVISGGIVSPKPTMKAVRMADEYAIKVGIEYATKGQLALASGYLLLLSTDSEGELPMAHPIAIAQRTVEAGYGASPLTFEGPLDPAELKYFTVTWDVELQAASDSIVPDNGTVEGQSVFLTLSGSAVAAGVQVHAFSQDERSVTFWLKVEASQQSRTQWTGVGELHVITIRIITTRGQVFERDISFRVKQL